MTETTMSDLAEHCEHCNSTGKVTLYGTYMGDADDQECPICSPPTFRSGKVSCSRCTHTAHISYFTSDGIWRCPICMPQRITCRRLEAGWWHIRGQGPCEWAQPPHWPCSEQVLREHAFPEASDVFIRSAMESIR